MPKPCFKRDLGEPANRSPSCPTLLAPAGEVSTPQTETRSAQRDFTDLVLRDAPDVIGPDG